MIISYSTLSYQNFKKENEKRFSVFVWIVDPSYEEDELRFVVSNQVDERTIHVDLLSSDQRSGSKQKIKLGTLGDRPKTMTIQLDSDFSVGCWCHRVTDANFAVGDRKCIGYLTDATDSQSKLLKTFGFWNLSAELSRFIYQANIFFN